MEQAFRRYEFKYILDRNTAWAIRAMLFAHGMEHDPSAKRHLSQNYAVTSLYFDSPTMGDYSDKAGGFLQRKKIRIRIYEPRLTENTKEIWLEKKSKHEMLISRIRPNHPWRLSRNREESSGISPLDGAIHAPGRDRPLRTGTTGISAPTKPAHHV